eukprot:scaffold949_cov186-Alexandrium_tamarense.AAC.16
MVRALNPIANLRQSTRNRILYESVGVGWFCKSSPNDQLECSYSCIALFQGVAKCKRRRDLAMFLE